MKRVLFVAVICTTLVWSCEDRDPAKNQPSTSNGVNGFVQKGPFVSGSNIIVQVLDDQFNPTGESFTVTTNDDFGSFELNSAVSGIYVEFIAQGYYFNEVIGEISSAPLTLRALARVTPDLSSNINVLTTLAKNRIIQLVNEEGKSFEAAKAQAENEVLSNFNIELPGDYDFNSMDIGESGAENAALLAISSILQGDQTVGQLSELISKVILDLEEDGTIDDQPGIQSKIHANAANLNIAAVKNNLAARYSDLGLNITVPEIEMFAKRLVSLEVVRSSPEFDESDVRYDIGSLSIYYNKALDGETVNSSTVTLTSSENETVEGVVSYDPDSLRIKFTPPGELVSERTYHLTINDGVKTLDGTSYSGTTVTFTTQLVDIESDLAAYFPLDGDANDASGHGMNATAANTTYGAGVRSQALKFSGEGSYLEMPNVMNLTQKVWTYSVWFRFDELPDGVATFLLATRLSGNAFWDLPLYLRPSLKTIATYNSTVLNTGENTVEVNKWQHMVLVINNGKIEMYLDGVLMTTRDDFLSQESSPGYEDFEGDAIGSYQYYTGKYYISEKFRGESFPAYMKGSVDNVRFYNRALNKYEVAKLFTESK